MLRTRAPSFVALVLTAIVGSSVVIGASALPTDAAASEDTDSFVVVLKDQPKDRGASAAAHARASGVETNKVFSHAVEGYAADLTSSEVAELRSDPRVASVEEDIVLHTQQSSEVPTGVQRIFGPQNPNLGIGGPTDQRVDVDIAVIDTGVANHSDLNVVNRVDCTGFGGCSSGGNDDNGHGTHVAGSAAAINNGTGVVGVAPGARVWSVRVCGAGGSCSLSAMIAGIDFVTANAGSIEVANMSLGGPGNNASLNQALTSSVNAGVVYAVAAGNSNQDAAGFQPAGHPDVITVSALADSDGQPGGTGGPPSCRPQSQDDQLADFSNWGSAVEIAAPGVCITSTWNNGGFNTISGTSMASPHAAGAAAVIASGDNPNSRADVLAIRSAMVNAGNLDWTFQSRGPGDVKEPLLDISDGSVFPPDGGPIDPPPPDDEVVFADDFESSQGWTRTNPVGSDTATTGIWDRGNPQPTSSGGAAMQLDNTTSGVNALVSGAAAGSSVGANDIDGGVTSALSPQISLPSGTVTLSFQQYLAHLSNATSADFLRVSVVSGGSTTTVFEELGTASVQAASWSQANVSISNFAGQTVQILVQAADAGSGSLVEAAVDDLTITQG